jgi:ABC-type sugar transport system substrate-binding protein
MDQFGRLSRRGLLRSLAVTSAVAVAGGLLAACGGGGATPTPASSGAQPTAAPAATPTAAAATEELWDVVAYYGTYDVSTKQPGRPAGSLQGPKYEKWTRPKANKPYMIGVSFPHLKDPYWLAVDYGIVDEAQILGVGIELVAAQGYNDLTGQINQVENLANRADIEGIILAAISYASQDQLVTDIVKNKKKPVIEVINDIQAPDIMAKALVSFYDMGYAAGQFVAEDSGGQEVTVVFLPGPAGSGWAPDTVDGFKAAVEEKVPGKVKILDVKWGRHREGCAGLADRGCAQRLSRCHLPCRECGRGRCGTGHPGEPGQEAEGGLDLHHPAALRQDRRGKGRRSTDGLHGSPRAQGGRYDGADPEWGEAGRGFPVPGWTDHQGGHAQKLQGVQV